MTKLRFGAFLVPHHPIGENPTLQLQSNLEYKLATIDTIKNKNFRPQ